MNKYVIGIDYGTDSCRALVVDAISGKELATAVSPYRRWAEGTYCDPQANCYRQHPQDYIDSLEEAVKGALAALSEEERTCIKGICFDTTGSTPSLTDNMGTPLALTDRFRENPDAMFILWKDHTAVAEADLINELAASWTVDYLAHEGGIYSSEWVWSKVAHILRNNLEMVSAAYSWVEHCDWITGLVTGNTKPETILRSRCAAGHKAMWHGDWGLPSEEFLSEIDPALGLMRKHLFETTATSDTVAGTVTPEWAARLGLPEGVKVGVGALDAHFGAIGAGAAPGVLTRIIGTSTCDIMIAEKSTLGGKNIPGICGQVDGSVVPDYVGIEAGQSAFGDIYAWFKNLMAWSLKNLMPENSETAKAIDGILPALMEEAAQVNPAQSGIVALDWMNGRRTPYADQSVKGAIAGLTLGSSAPMVMRALVEATAFGSKSIIEHLQVNGVKIDSINAIGGIAHKSPLVMQVLSDVLDMPIRVVRSEQACALGAAMFAAVAAGVYPNVQQAQKAMESGFIAEYNPNPKVAWIYARLYEQYRSLTKFVF